MSNALGEISPKETKETCTKKLHAINVRMYVNSKVVGKKKVPHLGEEVLLKPIKIFSCISHIQES